MATWWKVLAAPIAGVAAIAGEVLTAAHRSDLPSLENQDPSGRFGDPGAPPLRIVAVGDSSITAPGVDPLDAAWIRRLAHHFADRYDVTLESVAVGGSKARDVLADQLRAAVAHEPHLAVVSVGANDDLRATPVRRFERELDAIVTRLAEVAPGGVLVSGIGDLGTIPRLPTLPRGFARVRARSYDRAIARVVHRHRPVAAKTTTWGARWRMFEDPNGVAFAADQFHASAEGHRIFATAAIPVAERLVRRAVRRGVLAPGSPGSST